MALARSLAPRMPPRVPLFGQALRVVVVSPAVIAICIAMLVVASAGASSPAAGKAHAPASGGAAAVDRDKSGSASPGYSLGPGAKPWLGIRVQEAEDPIADQSPPSGSDVRIEGAMIADVLTGSPADAAQLQGFAYLTRRSDGTPTHSGDVVIAIDGVRVKSADDLASYMARTNRRVGDAVTIRIVRDDQVFDVLVRPGARDASQADLTGAI